MGGAFLILRHRDKRTRDDLSGPSLDTLQVRRPRVIPVTPPIRKGSLMNAHLILKAALASLAFATVGAGVSHAQQPTLLNPLTWFNTPNYRPAQPYCPTGACANPVRPVSYQSNYAPAVANTYYYPQPTNAFPASGVVNANCINGRCPNPNCPNGNCPVNCVNGQCFPTNNCPGGICPTTTPVWNGNIPNGYVPNGYGAGNGGFGGYAPNAVPNGSFYGPTGNVASPYYTTQTQPVNYSNGPMYAPAVTQPVYNYQTGNGNSGYVPPFRGRAADLPMEYGVNYR